MGGNVSTISRVLGSELISKVIQMLTGRKITDPTSGYRAINRTLMEFFIADYPRDYPEPISSLSALCRGYRVEEVEIEMKPRQHGKSSIGNLRSLLYMVKVVWAMCLTRAYR